MLLSKRIEKVMGACRKLLLFSCTGKSSKSVPVEKFTDAEDFYGEPY